MNTSLRNFLYMTIAVMLTLSAVGTFFVRFSALNSMVNHVEKVALSDDVVQEENGSYLGEGAGSAPEVIPVAEGLLRPCLGSDLLSVYTAAAADGVLDEMIFVEGKPLQEAGELLETVQNSDVFYVLYSVNTNGFVEKTEYRRATP